jgi:hypothetical protein
MSPDAGSSVIARDLVDGHHSLKLTAYNTAGLSASRQLEVKTDVTPPSRPLHLTVSPQMNGWVNTSEVSASWQNSGETTETDNQSGIAGFIYDLDKVTDGGNPTSPLIPDPAPVTIKDTSADGASLQVPGAGSWSLSVRTFDAAGNSSQPGFVDFTIDDIRPAAPVVEPITPINSHDRNVGKSIGWELPWWGPSGICGYSYAFSPVELFNPGEDAARPTISGWSLGVNLTPSQVQGVPEGAQMLHLRAFSCSGVAGLLAHVLVRVDFTPPLISVAPAGGFLRAGDAVAVAADDGRGDSGEPGVASLTCKVDAEPVACTDLTSAVLGDGRRHLEIKAADEAGNESIATADYLVDTEPPTGWISYARSDDPTLVEATVQDHGSGLRAARLEIQPLSGGAWTPLGAAFTSAEPTTSPTYVSGRIPDGGELEDGEYRLRMRAVDASGQQVDLLERIGGDAATTRIPVRAATVLTAGLTGPQHRVNPLARLRIPFGVTARLSGRLAYGDGRPIAGARLTAVAEQAGAPTRSIAELTTQADGTYSLNVPTGPSRTLSVRFAGNLVGRASQARAEVVVNGRVTLNPSRRRARSGQRIWLRGRVSAGGAALPLRGKTVELEFLINGRPSQLHMSRRTDAAGFFAFLPPLKARRRAVRFRVRAVVVAEPTWPYERGVSAARTIVISP